MADFLFPDVGEGIEEGKLVKWHVKEGDTVQGDHALCEVETDKAVVEIPSPHTGVIAKLFYKEGDIAKVGTPLISFAGDVGTKVGVPTESPPPIKIKDPDHDRAVEHGTSKVESNFVPKPPRTPIEPAPAPVAAQGPVVMQGSQTLAAPSTRRLAREKGVDINTVHGSGPGGRVMDADILGAVGGSAPAPVTSQAPARQPQAATPVATQISAPKVSAPVPQAKPGETIPYTGRRKIIGEHMVASHAAPKVTLFAEADATAFVELRERLKARAESSGVKLTYLALFAKATVAALKKHPLLNSSLIDAGIVTYPDVHLGIAVDAPKGLVVPVVRDADKKSVMAIAKDVAALADAARADTLSSAQMQGGTFSISSIGAGRVEGFTVMLNTPQTGILGIGGIVDKPWVVNGMVKARKLVTFSLSFDHRVLDGAEAAKFLTDLVSFVEDPDLLLVEAA